MELAEGLSLVVLYSGAFLMPLVASRVHMPAAVAEIIYGLLVARTGLVHENEITSFLAELGFIYLMFLVGMEIDFNRIEREGKRSIALAVLVAVLVLFLASFVAESLGLPVFMTLVLGAMSVGVLLVALVEAGASQTQWGQLLLLVGSVGEFITLMVLAAADLVTTHGVGTELLFACLEVFVLFAVAFVLLASMRLAVWWFPHSFQRWVREEDPSELGVRFGFVLMLGLAVVAAWAGMEAILGAFLAGMLVVFVFRESGVLETKLAAVGQGFFVPIFFINVGLTFDWGAVSNVSALLSELAVLATASLIVKLVPMFLLLLVGIRARALLAGSFLLATPLTLLVAIAALGSELGLLDDSASTSVILLAIATGVLFPVCFKLAAPRIETAPEPSASER